MKPMAKPKPGHHKAQGKPFAGSSRFSSLSSIFLVVLCLIILPL